MNAVMAEVGKTHGGIDMIPNPRANLPPLQFLHHDQITRINFLNLGGGAAYSLTEKVDVFASMIRTVAARNGHLIDRGVSMGASWSFTARRSKDSPFRAIAVVCRFRLSCPRQCHPWAGRLLRVSLRQGALSSARRGFAPANELAMTGGKLRTRCQC